MASIPASAIVKVTPSVVSAGGTALDLNGLMLTNTNRVPIGQVLSFPSATSVADYFGDTATEATAASIYFNGFENSNTKPGALLIYAYPTTAAAAWLRGGDVSSLTLNDLKALSGVLTITVNGTAKTSSTINLSAATSFSNAATIIQAAFTTPGFVVTYDSVSGGFLFTNSATGASSTITEASGTLSSGLKLSIATGAVVSQGADIATPAATMNAITAVTTNWASFFTTFDPDGGSGSVQKRLFAAWNTSKGNRYAYVAWDGDATATLSNAATTSMGYLIGTNGSNESGTFLVYASDYKKAAFIAGTIASIDFNQTNGRITFAFRYQNGLSADVTNETVAQNLTANGYNYYGAWATANDQFIGIRAGSVTGDFKWFDSYVNQIWLNNQFQLAFMSLLWSVYSIPYNTEGYSLIRAAAIDPITQAVNFGAIRPGVTLSSAQAAQVNSAAGMKISDTLSTQGWYLQIKDATPQVRAARGTPPMTFWYMDGGSVHSINLASVEVQ